MIQGLKKLFKKLFKKRDYVYYVSGFILQHNGGTTTFDVVTVQELIKTDRQFLAIKQGVINMLEVKDANIMSIFKLKRTMSSNELMIYKAQKIADGTECGL